MRRTLIAVGWVGLLVGCRGEPPPVEAPPREELFDPVRMRLHPVFTQVRDWSGDGNPDGFEVLVEMLDSFGDTTKAAGRVRFELYDYRPFNPDPRGDRLVAPYEGRLDTAEQQLAHWSRPSRAYTFQLAYPRVQASRSYVLLATFEQPDGKRFFDQIILEGRASRPPAATEEPRELPDANTDNPPQPRSNQP